MAYRRRQNLSRSSTFKEEFHDQPPPTPPTPTPPIDNSNDKTSSSFFSSSNSLAAQAIKASAASRRNPSLSFAFNPPSDAHHNRSKSFEAFGGDAGKVDSKNGFWGVLAQKAKSILDDDNNNNNNSQSKHNIIPQRSTSFNTFSGASAPQSKPSHQFFESNNGKLDNPKLRKGLDKITSSLNQLGDTFEKAFEEGKTIVESKTADLRTQIRRKGSNGSEETNQYSDLKNPWQHQQEQTQNVTNRDTQLKASRDVAMATAAKAKLLLRELKTVKADLAFSKARCSQLEEENKMLRDREGTNNKGQSGEDDDLIRLQLETLLAEKARLARENEVYSRENRFLREIVEYHQLTMQDVVYLDEGMEEVSEVYPVDQNGFTRMLSVSPHSSTFSSPTSHDDVVLLQSEIPTVPEEDYSKSSTSEDEGPSPTDSASKHAK